MRKTRNKEERVIVTNYDEYGNPTDDEQNDGQDGPKALRSALAKKDKELKELRAQLDSLTVESRSRKVADTLVAKGLPEKVGKLIPQDADVDEWLTEYAELFGTPPGKSAESAPEAEVAEPPQQVDPALANAWEQISTTTQQGQAPATANVNPAVAELQKLAAEGGDIGAYMTAKGLTQQWG